MVHGRVLSLVEAQQLLQGLLPDERHIAGEDKDVFVIRDGGPRTLDCMACAALVCLFNKVNACGSHGFTHPLCLVSDDNMDIGGCSKAAGDRNHVPQQCFFRQSRAALWAAAI